MKELSKKLSVAVRPQEMLWKIIWAGVFPAFGVYVFVALQRAKMGDGNGVSSSQMLLMTAVLGVSALAVSLVLRRLVLSPRAVANVLNGKQPALNKVLINSDSPKAGAVLKEEVLDALEGDELRLYRYSSGLFYNLMIQWGMVNACALFGMILPPPQYQPMAAVVAAAVSAVCMLFHFPSVERIFAAGLELADFERGMNRR